MKELVSCDEAMVEALQVRLKQAVTIAEFQRIQCVLLRAVLGCPASEIAQVLGWATATVHITHSRWAREGEALFDLKGKGGRYNQNLTEAEEAEVLAPFLGQAAAGNVLKVAEIQAACEARVGKAVPNSTTCRLLQRHGWRKVTPRPAAPQGGCDGAWRLQKKFRRLVRREVRRQAPRRRRVRVMFQDEGRFGLMGRPRRCWAPRPVRPLVGARLQRQFTYAFAAVSPHDGVMDSLVLPWVNAETMTVFLATVAERHADEFIVMVMDPSRLAYRRRLGRARQHASGLPAALQPRAQPGRAPVGVAQRKPLRQCRRQ